MKTQPKQQEKSNTFYRILNFILNVGVFFFVAIVLIILTKHIGEEVEAMGIVWGILYSIGIVGILVKTATISWSNI